MRSTPATESGIEGRLTWSRALACAVCFACASVACSSFSEAKGDDDAGTTVDAGVGDGDGGEGEVGAAPIVLDTFSRVVQTGFGSAEIGGDWIGSGTRDVADGVGHLFLKPGTGASASIGPTAEPDVDVQAVVSCDRLGDPDAGLGSGVYVSLIARRNAGSTYFAKLIIVSKGTVSIALDAVIPGAETALDRQNAVVTLKANEKLRVRFQLAGVAPTRLRVKAWKLDDVEPAAWNSEVMDRTPTLQQAGVIGIDTYLSSLASDAVIVSVDDFVARPAR